MSMERTCPDGETLFYYSEGLLDPEDHRLVADHLAACAACREQVRIESELSVSLRQLPLPEPAPSLASAVRTRIVTERRRRRASYWWWVVAAAFVLASGLRWLVVADLSARGAAVAVLDLVVFVVRSPLTVVGWLTDPDTWSAGGSVLQSIGVAVASSPVTSSAVIVSVFVVALAANAILFGLARRMVSR